jgi:hypothetical protein
MNIFNLELSREKEETWQVCYREEKKLIEFFHLWRES